MTGGRKSDILIVDDTPSNLRFLSAALTEHGYKVRSVTSGSMALTVAHSALPELILLDVMMPEMDGYEVCQRLKADERTREIPVIFLSALDEVLDKVKAFTVGGVDYITKPFQLEEVLVRIENQLCLWAAKEEIRKLNTELEQRVRQRTVQLEREIVERQQMQEKLLHMALHDTLTGLPNRTLFMKRLGQVLERTRQHPNYLFAVLFLDCDRFKVVNDSLGHSVGDQLLVAVARRIEACLRPESMLARLGGDEFTVLLEGIQNLESAIYTAEWIQKELAQPFHLVQHEIFTNASIGIVLGTKSYEQPEHILRDADTAMYQAKAMGKARYQVFDAAMHFQALTHLQLETDLRRAIEREELVVYYQPIVCLESGKISGFESLVRWVHPKQGMMPPDLFIPIAEETGLIEGIDRWVLRQACRQLCTWYDEGLAQSSLQMSVNLSVKDFIRPELISQIDRVLQETGLDSCHLKLEITESALMSNADTVTQILTELKSRHIQLIIDDFGTGYSSLSYLHRFPVDALKIDRSFVSRINVNAQNLEIVQAIVALADNLGMATIAEGLETAYQLEKLRELGCTFGQGFFFSKPMDSSSARALLKAQPQW